MRKAILMFFLVVAGLMITNNLLADWGPTPDLTDDFTVSATAGPNLGYIRDPDLLTWVGTTNEGAIEEARFYNSYPGGWTSGDGGLDYDPDPIANNPSSDHTVMGIGNLVANIPEPTYGLCYIDIAAASPGGPDIFLNHEDYKMRAYVYCLGTNDTAKRYQGGLYLRAGSGQPDLFRFGIFHNTSMEGNGPGFGFRGTAEADQELNYTSPLADGRWVLMEIEAVGTLGAVGADVDGDGTINKADSGEYLSGIDLDVKDVAEVSLNLLNGYPAFWTVGEYSDQSPMLVDDVELWYQPYVPPTPTLPPGFTPVEMNWAVYY